MGDLITYHFLFTCEVVTPLELDEHSGASLRASLFDAVWQRFCTNKEAHECAACPLHAMCPVSALVAPLRDEHPRGRDVPRPYVILPPLGAARRYLPGETLLFGITLFGSIVKLLPYILMASKGIESAGLGKKLQEHNWQRGRFVICTIESYHPLRGERELIYQHGKPLVNAPTFAVTATDVQARAATLSKDTTTLNFLTPTRIRDQEHSVGRAEFRPLLHRLLERLYALRVEYANGEEQPYEERKRYVDLAREVRCVDDATNWEEAVSFSRRTRQSSWLSGIIGRATFSGDLEPFREFLVWGELIHVGKSCVKGNGWYQIVETSQ